MPALSRPRLACHPMSSAPPGIFGVLPAPYAQYAPYAHPIPSIPFISSHPIPSILSIPSIMSIQSIMSILSIKSIPFSEPTLDLCQQSKKF